MESQQSSLTGPGAPYRRLGWIVAAGFLVVGALVRCLNLDTNPPGLWQDEASTGLDAWLLWHTGRDRAGDFLPLISRSFGDYPLTLYRYLTAPIVGVLGLSIGRERWVAALFGTILIVAAAAVTRSCAGERRGLAVVVTAALCPTWIHFSRYGSEAILLPATLTLGWLGIDAGARTPRWRWAIWLGALSLGLSAYTYHAVKLILPLWMAGFLVYQYPTIRRLVGSRARIHVIGPALLFAAIVLPSVLLAFSDHGQARGRTVLAWYHHQGLSLVRVIASHYLSYFDPGMLFIRGGPAVAQSIPGLGMWNAIELPLLILGLAAAFREPRTRRFYGFVVFWFLIGPLPGGVTYETQNMGRAIAWLPAPQILSATGLAVAVDWALTAARGAGPRSRRLWGGAVLTTLAAGWVLTAYAVWVLTLVVYPRLAERDWQFGVSRAWACAKRAQTQEKFIVSRAFPMAMLFSQFHLAERLRGVENPSTIWDLGDRKIVRPNELYLVPASQPQPLRGERICTVVHQTGRRPEAYVYRGTRPVPAAFPEVP